MVKLIKISPSTAKADKRYTAHFMLDNDKVKRVHFGSSKHENYTIHKDEKRKDAYRKRHAKDLKTNDPTRAGYLSYYILWNKDTLHKSIQDYKKTFNL
jgi:hypothetical protein